MFSQNDGALGALWSVPDSAAGATGGRPAKVVAAFRDPRTIEAILDAPPIVRLFLEEAGFHAKEVDVEGRVSGDTVTENELRQTLLAQLSAALSNRAMKKALGRTSKECAFNVNTFIAAVVSGNFPQVDDDCIADQYRDKVLPRRPAQLRRNGVKSRQRPV